jgi:hypothetical protein
MGLQLVCNGQEIKNVYTIPVFKWQLVTEMFRSSAKGGGSDLARVALRVYFVSLGSIQH